MSTNYKEIWVWSHIEKKPVQMLIHQVNKTLALQVTKEGRLVDNINIFKKTVYGDTDKEVLEKRIQDIDASIKSSQKITEFFIIEKAEIMRLLE